MKAEKLTEVVKYKNELNRLNWGELTEQQIKLFFYILKEITIRGKNPENYQMDLRQNRAEHLWKRWLILPLTEFKKITHLNDAETREVAKRVIRNPLFHMQYDDTDYGSHGYNFFHEVFFDMNKQLAGFAVSSELLDKIEYVRGYTRMNQVKYNQMHNKHALAVAPLLSQNNKRKEFSLKTETFFEKLGIVGKYHRTDNKQISWSDVDRYVIAPMLADLPILFPNIRMEKIKTGRKITSVKFTWK
jgi:hypothetical protein